MTVEQLIETLFDFPPDAPVGHMIWTGEFSVYEDFDEITETTFDAENNRLVLE